MTFDDFRANLQAHAHRRRVAEQRLFDRAPRAIVPASALPSDLCAELDALAEALHRGQKASQPSRPATDEAKRQMSVTARNRTEPDKPRYAEPEPEPARTLPPEQVAEVERLRRESASHWTWNRLGERFGVDAYDVKLAVLGMGRRT